MQRARHPAALHQRRAPPPGPRPPDHAIEPRWLREQYQHRQRSLKDIAAETGTPVGALATAARTAGIRVRHGINGRAHPLAALGGPCAFTTDVWNIFTRPGAEQRIRRLLAIPGQPSLQRAARQLGIRHALLASQVRQLEAVVGTELLRTGPDERLTLTACGGSSPATWLQSWNHSRNLGTRPPDTHRDHDHSAQMLNQPALTHPAAAQLPLKPQLALLIYLGSLHGGQGADLPDLLGTHRP
jgi:hypothetical protein